MHVRAILGVAALAGVLLSGCASTGGSRSAPTPAGTSQPLSPEAQAGKDLIVQKGCGGCHVIPGVPGATGMVGPSLAGVADRKVIAGGAVTNNGPQDLKRWIMDPTGIKPDTYMPNLHLSDDQANKIVAYLETLR